MEMDLTAGSAGKEGTISVEDSADGTGRTNIIIWDMDETLILLKSLLNGSYAANFNGSKNIDKGKEIGKAWEKHILDVCDAFFFYEQVENYNEPFLQALQAYDDGRDLSNYDFNSDGFGPPVDDSNKRKLVYRHRIISEKYAKGLHSILNKEMVEIWNDLYNITDAYTDGWYSSARAFLEESIRQKKGLTPISNPAECTADSSHSGNQNINVLVTSGSLVPSLVKCLLFRLDEYFLKENVYSSWEVGKFQCFSWIKERFDGPSVQFCVIGDGFEECEAAQLMKWPFIRIDMQPGGTHRFPGLTMKTVNHYMEIIYGSPEDEREAIL